MYRNFLQYYYYKKQYPNNFFDSEKNVPSFFPNIFWLWNYHTKDNRLHII